MFPSISVSTSQKITKLIQESKDSLAKKFAQLHRI